MISHSITIIKKKVMIIIIIIIIIIMMMIIGARFVFVFKLSSLKAIFHFSEKSVHYKYA